MTQRCVLLVFMITFFFLSNTRHRYSKTFKINSMVYCRNCPELFSQNLLALSWFFIQHVNPQVKQQGGSCHRQQ